VLVDYTSKNLPA